MLASWQGKPILARPIPKHGTPLRGCMPKERLIYECAFRVTISERSALTSPTRP